VASGSGHNLPPAPQKQVGPTQSARGARRQVLQSFRTRWKQCTVKRIDLDRELPKTGDVPRSPLSENGSLMPSVGTFQSENTSWCLAPTGSNALFSI